MPRRKNLIVTLSAHRLPLDLLNPARSTMTISETFHARLRGEAGAGHSDITEHLALLKLLVRPLDHVTEFGVRTGNSTIAFLAGLAPYGTVHSYDINPPAFELPLDAASMWRFTQADTAGLAKIDRTDLLFIDTLHTYAQVKAELKHAAQVRRFLVFHDTVLNATQGEANQEGIGRAIAEFRAENTGWEEFAHCRHNNGLLILERNL